MLQYDRYTKSKQTKVSSWKLERGDVFMSSGKLFAYDRTPKGARNIYAKNLDDGKTYRVSNRDEFEVLGKYKFPKKEAVTVTCDRENLKAGDLFVITGGAGKDAKLFRYESHNPKSVVGINVLTGNKVRIDNGFKFIKIENLKH